MTIKFYSDNLVNQATITGSSVNSQFPLSNLKDSRRTKVARSTSNSDSFVFDLQETSEIDSFFIVDNPRDGFGVSTLLLELNATSNFSSAPFSQSISYSIQHGVGFAEFTQQDYRFARLVMTSSLGFCELSKIFIGKAITLINDKSINYGWTYQDRDLSRVQENRYGQKFVDRILRQRVFNIQFTNLDKDQLDQIFEIYDSKGIVNPFFIRIGCDEMINEKRRFAGMVYFSSIPTITNTTFNRYSISMNLEEGM